MQFYAVCLEDSLADQQLLESAFDVVQTTFNDFMRDKFSCRDRKSKERKGPNVTLDLKVVGDVSTFRNSLLCAKGELTEHGRQCLFLILDYYLSSKDNYAVTLPECESDGMPSLEWLGLYFPAIPKLWLTQGHAPDLEPEMTEEIDFINKHRLLDEDRFSKKLAELFQKWWQPTFWKKLSAYAMEGDDSWHTPGHNAGSAFRNSELQKGFYYEYGKTSFQTDLSVSVDDLGDLSEPDLDSPLRASQRRSAEVFGSKESFYITNGTSTSNKALLMTLLRPGETVLLDRNCHKSVHQAVVMSGAIPIYLSPVFNTTLGIWQPLSLKELGSYIDRDYEPALQPRVLILTTCTYEGVLYPIDIIAEMCDRAGIVFCADEAWAPYLRFHPHYVCRQRLKRYSAMDGGAHFSVQSTHKALAAFSQASMIHVSKRFAELFIELGDHWKWLQQRFSVAGEGSYERFRHDLFEVLRYWHSTSPHYPMIASLDRAGIQMRFEGARLIDDRLNWINQLHIKVSEYCPGALLELESLVDSVTGDYSNYMKDPLKIVLRAKDEASLKIFKEVLEDRRIRWEKASRATIELLATIGTQADNILTDLTEAVRVGAPYLGPGKDDIKQDSELAKGQVRVSPRYAALCDGELVEVAKAKNRICGQMLTPYPPGIPVFLPGLEINTAMIDAVTTLLDEEEGHKNVHGIYEDNGKHLVRVLSADEQIRFENDERFEGELAAINGIRTLNELGTQ